MTDRKPTAAEPQPNACLNLAHGLMADGRAPVDAAPPKDPMTEIETLVDDLTLAVWQGTRANPAHVEFQGERAALLSAVASLRARAEGAEAALRPPGETVIRCEVRSGPYAERQCLRFHGHDDRGHRFDDPEIAALWNGMTYWYRKTKEISAKRDEAQGASLLNRNAVRLQKEARDAAESSLERMRERVAGLAEAARSLLHAWDGPAAAVADRDFDQLRSALRSLDPSPSTPETKDDHR